MDLVIITFVVTIVFFIIYKYDIFNVYGHTIFTEPILNEYSCGIDLGCFYQNKEKLPNPRLCALEFPSMKIYTQESLEN